MSRSIAPRPGGDVPRRGVMRAALRMCSRRRAYWLVPALLALLLARRLRRAGKPLDAPSIYALH